MTPDRSPTGGPSNHSDSGDKVKVARIAVVVLAGALVFGFLAGLLADRWFQTGDVLIVGASSASSATPALGSAGTATPNGSVDSAPLSNSSGTTFRTIRATWDTYVNSEKPMFSYGGADTVRIDSQPQVITYLRFDVSGVNGSIVTATLRMYAISPSIQGFLVQGVSAAGRDESQLTFDNRPADDTSQLGSSGPFEAASWPSVEVTEYLTGDGEYSFMILGISRTAVSFGSLESGKPAELLLELDLDSDRASP